MSKNIWVRRITEHDTPQLAQWLTETPHNYYDQAVYFYPHTVTLVAASDRNLVYMPIQRTITLESLAVNPDTTNGEKAIAMVELIRTAVYEASLQGVKEIYFVATNPDTAHFAERRKLERIQHPVYRIKVDALP